MSTASNAAFSKLLEYDKRSTTFSPVSQGGGAESQEWSGVTFGLAGERLTCNISNITEIIPCPPVTSVPGAKDWIIGLANVRGELLTVIDLNRFLTGDRTVADLRTRLLTTTLNKAPIGLLISEVYGQRHFLDGDSRESALPEDSALRSIVSRQHDVGSETWQELDLDALFNSAEFLNGAA